MTITTRLSATLLKYEKLIPVVLWLLFLAITLPGISWGGSGIWNPDELVHWVNKALTGDYRFDETNFDYPSLPKWVMYWAGKLVYLLGYAKPELVLTARTISVILGGLVVVLVFLLARKLGGGIYTSLLAALLMLFSSELAINARFAHNDIYQTFFITLTVFCLVNYRLKSQRLWLYAAFLGAGLAASSKYNGGVILLTVLVVFLLVEWRLLKTDFLRLVEIGFIGLILSAGGFFLGTPKALFWMGFYFKRMAPALLRHANYDRSPTDVIGLIGQWKVLTEVLGAGLLVLCAAAFCWYSWKALMEWRGKRHESKLRIDLVSILLLAIVTYNLPILTSFNYPTRFFLPLVPFLAVLAALFLSDLFDLAARAGNKTLQGLVVAAAILAVIFSLLRAVSIGLLFINDNRIAAGQYLGTLPAGKTIEVTLYPPNVPAKNFSKVREYPVQFIKFAGQKLPAKMEATYNKGEAGIEARKPDYLVIDSFTYDRMKDDYICSLHQLECDFFRRLLAGKTNYHLLQTFNYTLPPYLPELSPPFLNPIIHVFERVPPNP